MQLQSVLSETDFTSFPISDLYHYRTEKICHDHKQIVCSITTIMFQSGRHSEYTLIIDTAHIAYLAQRLTGFSSPFSVTNNIKYTCEGLYYDFFF